MDEPQPINIVYPADYTECCICNSSDIVKTVEPDYSGVEIRCYTCWYVDYERGRPIDEKKLYRNKLIDKILFSRYIDAKDREVLTGIKSKKTFDKKDEKILRDMCRRSLGIRAPSLL